METPLLAYGPATNADIPHLARLVFHAFAGTLEGSSEWIKSAGIEHIRVLRPAEPAAVKRSRRGSRQSPAPPVASLLRVPMAQFFGGRSVAMVGIAGVAVGPESRGRGLARTLMQHAMLELARERIPLSCLYASTQTLYRLVGFEQAGCRFQIRLPLARLGITERAATASPLSAADMPTVRRCYTRYASRFNGALDRGDYCWNRIVNSRGEPFHGFGISIAGELLAYVFLSQRRKPDTGRSDVAISDLAFTTPASGRRLLGFLADFATTGDDALMFGGPVHPLLALLPQQTFQAASKDLWMLRLTDTARALSSRGYSRSLTTTLALNITDDLIPRNSGRYMLRITQGRARVNFTSSLSQTPRGRGRGEGPSSPNRGTPTLRLTPRGLAAIYSGFFTPSQAAIAGLVDADDRSLGAAEAIFAGGTPWMSDMF